MGTLSSILMLWCVAQYVPIKETGFLAVLILFRGRVFVRVEVVHNGVFTLVHSGVHTVLDAEVHSMVCTFMYTI